jgi:ribosome recycling factor
MAKNDEHARDSLKKLKAGGRFNPDLIGALKVQPDRKESAAYPIRELAQVVPKGGRTISILVHEEAYVKPIMSAVQASKDFNQQPQRDPDNELELIIKIEPERREDIVKRIKAVCHEWRERVRSVRHKRDKLHVAWKKDGLIGPDLKRKVDTELDKLIKAKVAEIDAAEKETLKATEGK